MSDPNIFNQLLTWPIVNLLVAFYQALVFIGIPGAFGWAIILLTLTIRLLLYPLTVSQLRSVKKMAELKPHLDKLAKKHKDDKKKLQQEQMRLFQQAGVNPAAGCLPVLLQFPVLIALFRVFSALLSNGDTTSLVKSINSVLYFPFLQIQSLELSFLGINLAAQPNDWQKQGIVLLAIPIITGIFQVWQSRLMSVAPAKETVKQKEKKESKKKQAEDDFQAAMQTQMKYFMPVFVAYLSFNFPVGLSLYWNTFTVFGIIQQLLINRSERT